MGGRTRSGRHTSMMSTHLAMPRRGHLEQVHHIFGYLKEQPKRSYSLIHSTRNWMRGHLPPMIGMTFTGMQKSQFRGTCLHLEVKRFRRIAL